jgi:hypothetical protein
MPNPLPSIEFLRRVVIYDPATGVLTWLPRTPDMIGGATEAARRKSCACWNGQYAGKPALIGIDGYGYYHGPIAGRYLKAHRVAWAIHHGKWPMLEINHRNGDRRDNRIDNLRDVDHRTCLRNCKLSKINTSGHAGVHWHRRTQRWQASIRTTSGIRSLGSFISRDDAVTARQAAEVFEEYDPNHGKPRDFANHFVPAKDRPASADIDRAAAVQRPSAAAPGTGL